MLSNKSLLRPHFHLVLTSNSLTPSSLRDTVLRSVIQGPIALGSNVTLLCVLPLWPNLREYPKTTAEQSAVSLYFPEALLSSKS